MSRVTVARSVLAERGVTLVELMIALTVTAVIAAAMLAVFVSQTRLIGLIESQRTGRAVSRSAANVLTAELRMIEAAGGVESAASTALTLRVPYAVGVLCATSSSEATVSLLLADSMLFARPGYSGYAWRTTAGGYVYEAGTQSQPDVAGASAVVCAGASITTPPGGILARLTPGVPAATGAMPGTPVLLYRRVRYEFTGSADFGGRTMLIRTPLDGGEATVLSGPFDGATRFRFFVAGEADAQDAPPSDLSDLRGVELDLVGQGHRPAAPGKPPAVAPLSTAIFFHNVSN